MVAEWTWLCAIAGAQDAELREYRKPDGTIGYRDERGWYRRKENNGWRPVAERYEYSCAASLL